MKALFIMIKLCIVLLALLVNAHAQEQQFYDCGDFKLMSGEVVRDCPVSVIALLAN